MAKTRPRQEKRLLLLQGKDKARARNLQGKHKAATRKDKAKKTAKIKTKIKTIKTFDFESLARAEAALDNFFFCR
jgi:hypothetical protein